MLPGSPDQNSERLARLEEAQMFAERRADDLTLQIGAIEQSLRQAQDRLRRLERAVATLNGPEEDPE